MIIIDNLEQVANQIETERGIRKELLYDAVEQSLTSACRKRLADGSQLECALNPSNGSVVFYRVKEVVEDVLSESTEITLKDAKKIDKSVALEGEVRVAFEPPNFGRIAAQVAKQVITQRLREAERDSVYADFEPKLNKLINGTVQKIENGNYLINLGRTEAVLFYRDQIPGEKFELNETIRVFVRQVDKENRRSMVAISRSHPGLLRALFETEIPEISDGIIEVMSVSREPGVRAKVAVKTNNPAIGAVGTCVGQMGGRIQAIIKELGNEKIDVLEWNEDPAKFVANALKPAAITQVIITDTVEKLATVVAPNDQLSLAIGKRGVNVRLSVMLTGWKLDVIDQENFEQNKENILASVIPSPSTETADTATGVMSSSLAKAIAADADSEIKKEKIKETHAKLNKKLKTIGNQEDQGMKVSVLSKLLNMKTAELIEKAAAKGIQISSNRAILTPEQVESVKKKVFI